MTWIITKYLITAGLVVFISEVAKRSDKMGGFIAALPLMTLLTLVWLYVENQSEEKIANHAYYTFLVCNSNTTDVSTIPLPTSKNWVWANNHG